MIVTDVEGRIIFANRAVEKRTGYSIAEIIGRKLGDLWGGHMDRDFYAHMWHTLAVRKLPFTGLIKNQRKDGTLFYAEMRIYPIKNIHGKVEAYMSIEPDVTKRVMEEEALSALIHRAKSPASAEKLVLELLKSNNDNLTDGQRNLLEELSEMNAYTTDLLRNLLVASRLRELPEGIRKKTSSLQVLVKSIIMKYRREIKQKKLRIVYSKDPSCVLKWPLLVHEVIDNLISNAVKYSHPGGTITVSCIKKGKTVVFTCADRGVGIPPSQQKSIFTPFFRASNVKGQHSASSGLGLYLAKRIAEDLGYKLSFSSKEGNGTTFTLTMPA